MIPAAVIDDIRTNGDRTAWATGEWGRMFAPIGKSMGYRSGWYVVDDAPGCVFAMGIHGQNLLLDFENRMVVAKFSSWKAPIVPLPLLATHKAFARAQRSLKRSKTQA